MAQVQTSTRVSDEEAKELQRKVSAGAREGVALALEEHYRMGRSIVVWRDGKVVWLKPEEYKDSIASSLGISPAP
jgi:hypothetical protein